jgi:hypothetical protein
VGIAYGSDGIDVARGGTRVLVQDNQLSYLGGRGIYVAAGGFFSDNTLAGNVQILGNSIDNALNRVIDAGGINTSGSGMQIQNNTITNLFSHDWNVGVGTAQAFYLDVGSYRSDVSGNQVNNVQVGVRLNCQGENSYHDNPLGTVLTQRVAVTFAGGCTSTPYIVSRMQAAGCVNIGQSNESCSCYASGTCATDSTVVDAHY